MRTIIQLILICVVQLVCMQARAQAAQQVPDPHLVLARMCAHEASLPFGRDIDHDGIVDQWTQQRDHDVAWGDDCWLIHHVLLRGAERMRESAPQMSFRARYFRFAVEYSHGRFLAPLPQDTNRWAMDLHPDGHEPMGWHGTVHWSHMRQSWEYAWAYTHLISRMTLDDLQGPTALWTCAEPITDWGGRMDHAHADSVGLIEVACDGASVNTSYVRPGLRVTED